MLAVWLVALSAEAAAAAAPDPVLVRAAVNPASSSWVGGRVSIDVTVLESEPTEGNALFDLPALPRAILARSPDAPVYGSETIDGVAYTSRTYELLYFSQAEGRNELPAVDVRVRLAGSDEMRTLATPPLEVGLERPAGVGPDDFVVTTPELSIVERWEPEPGAAKPGDAFRRTVELRATDTLALALPPLPASAPDGIGAYPADPELRDRSARGDLTGERIDAVSYVAKRAGRHELPALTYTWWDPWAEELHRETLDAVAWDVAVDATGGAATRRGSRSWIPLLAAAGVLVLLVGAWRARDTVARWRARRADSESGRFARLSGACQRGDPAAAWAAWCAWRERNPSEDPALLEAARELQRHLVESTPWDGAALRAAAAKARRQVPALEESPALGPLNPS